MLNDISSILYLGLGLTSVLAAFQDFRTNDIHLATWIPALAVIPYYLYKIGSAQFVGIELLWAAAVFVIGVVLHHKKKFGGGDVMMTTLIAFVPVGFVLSLFASVLLSPRFRGPKNGNVPFVGVMGAAFVIYALVMMITPFYFL